MALGFEVRNLNEANATTPPEVMLTIQVLTERPAWGGIDLDVAQKQLTQAYAAAFARLSQLVEAAK